MKKQIFNGAILNIKKASDKCENMCLASFHEQIGKDFRVWSTGNEYSEALLKKKNQCQSSEVK